MASIFEIIECKGKFVFNLIHAKQSTNEFLMSEKVTSSVGTTFFIFFTSLWVVDWIPWKFTPKNSRYVCLKIDDHSPKKFDWLYYVKNEKMIQNTVVALRNYNYSLLTSRRDFWKMLYIYIYSFVSTYFSLVAFVYIGK